LGFIYLSTRDINGKAVCQVIKWRSKNLHRQEVLANIKNTLSLVLCWEMKGALGRRTTSYIAAGMREVG
jgi:hypothetical protein